MLAIIIISIYLVGVIIALVVIAWTNSGCPNHGVYDEMPKGFCLLSWIVPLALLLGAIGYLLSQGTNKLLELPYNWLYDKFNSKRQ
jgi:hypothetical protein